MSVRPIRAIGRPPTGTAGSTIGVRSTHGINCTGSCSWKIHVKDGLVTWETQETDYPSNGPHVPDYEPRRPQTAAPYSATRGSRAR